MVSGSFKTTSADRDHKEAAARADGELFGVGSQKILEKVDVDVIVNLPGVGETLNDHSATGI